MMIKKPKKIRDTDDLKNVNEQSQAMANANASFEKQNMNDSPSGPPNRSSQRSHMSLASGTELRYLSYDRFGHVFNDFTATLMYFSFSAGKGEGSFMLWTTTRPFEKEIDSQHERRADNHPAPIVACGAARKARKGGGLAGIRAVIVAVALPAVLAQAPQARAQTPGPPEARELVIGTKVAPPFAMKAEDGTWRGISIDLWRRIANQTHLRYRFQETTLKGLIDGVAEGSLDAAVAALTVTGSRHRVVDFTQPFYSAGLGIAVPSDAGITWWPIIRNVFSLGFFRAAAVLFAISLSVGVVLWLIEHRHNEHFGAHRRGLGASVWWSAAAMTQAGGAAGEKVPMTLAGRLLAMVWMVTSVIVFASFTAALTSQLTLKHLRGTVNGEADLRYVRVAAIAGTETTEYLGRERIAHQVFADVEAGLSALQKGRIDALVYDRPLLLWLVNERFSGSLRVLDGTFDPQVYAIALPQGSELRMPIDLALLDAIRSDWWRETLVAYLGPSGGQYLF